MADQYLEGLLQDKLIEVADYQRPYAWGEKQLRDLWQDLDLTGTERHYAGTLVLQRTDRIERSLDGKDLTTYEVVDGQQRLTTCVILLEQLRRAMSAINGRDAEEVDLDGARRDLARLVRVNIGGVKYSRLRLGTDLRDFFERSIIGEEITDKARLVAGEKRLRYAADFFRAEIEKLTTGVDGAEAARRLVELRARVCYRLQFLVYDVETSAEVGVLFETLNDRGQALSELEKVKNYLLYLSRQISGEMGKRLADTINQAWSDIFANMATLTIDDDALLRAHWAVTEDPNQRNWNRTASIKAKFPRAKYVPSSGRLAGDPTEASAVSADATDELFKDVTTYVETLRRCSAFLRDIYDPNAAYLGFGDARLTEQVRRQSAALVRSGSVANFRPLLLAARLKHPTDAGLYLRLVELCEKFAARAYVICVARSNAGQASLHRAAHDLHNGKDPDEVIRDITATLWRLAPDDAVRANFGPAVEWYYRRSHKYVLYEYELQAVRSEHELPAFGDLTSAGSKTTEHILPQNPAAESAWWSDFTREDHAKLLNTIGNLVLTRDNSAYSNKDYTLKRGAPGQERPRCYFSPSALAREREIAQKFETWTPATIETRRGEIETWALSRWRIEPLSDLLVEVDYSEDDADVPEDEPEFVSTEWTDDPVSA